MRTVLAPVLVIVFAACSRTPQDNQASSTAPALGVAPAAAPAPVEPGVAQTQPESQSAPPAAREGEPRMENANEVKRYGDEATLGSVETNIAKSVVAHDAPGTDNPIHEVGLLLG